MFVDYTNIMAKAGNGGNGRVSFRREKYVQQGGPDGGNGGRGGDVVFVADGRMNTLMDFKFKKKFFARNGEDGGQRNQHGRDGESIVIRVPVGTLIREKETGKIIVDMYKDGMTQTVLRGGRGGKGNMCFATPTRRTPDFATPGQKTTEHALVLELKTIADVGLVGFPNVGKSTILSLMSAARPEIANYHFTTLVPNLGVVETDGYSFVMADIPGLIEGASEGAGLGLNFLKHVERTRVLLHVVDISGSEGRDPAEDFRVINEELRKYSEKLSRCRQLVVCNKIDLCEGNNENYQRFAALYGNDYEIFLTSAARGEKDFLPVKRRIAELLKEMPAIEAMASEITLEEAEIDETQWEVRRDSDGVALVEGRYIENLLERINFDDVESNRYFHKTLRRLGIIDALRRMGVRDGDTVRVLDVEFDFVE
ncbi:MAG: GTPase ObgE [Eubacteriales bacterium]|nr:GTPase ObgE [Eubacteriales bacterium]